MKRTLCAVVLFCLVGLCPVGCKTRLSDDTIFNPGYYGRHLVKFLNDCHEFRIDIDRTRSRIDINQCYGPGRGS